MLTEGTRNQSLEILKDIICSAKELVIIDPYIFNIKTTTTRKTESKEKHLIRKNINFKKCIDDIIYVLPKNLKSLLIIANTLYGENAKKREKNQKEVIQALRKKIPNVHFEALVLGKLHDRLWISNRQQYLISGASLNGIGTKLSFFYDIQEEENKKKINEYFINKIKNQKYKDKEKIFLSFFNKINKNR